MSFLKQKNLKKYIIFIRRIEKIKYFTKIYFIKKKLYNKNPDLYNYEKLLNLITDEKKNENNILDKFFVTNNISESLHRKINFY